jgi:hypothetical protein
MVRRRFDRELRSKCCLDARGESFTSLKIEILEEPRDFVSYNDLDTCRATFDALARKIRMLDRAYMRVTIIVLIHEEAKVAENFCF